MWAELSLCQIVRIYVRCRYQSNLQFVRIGALIAGTKFF